MNIDLNALTVENLTREIMDAMNDDQIKEFKSRLTAEEKAKLQKRFGGSTMASLDEEMNVQKMSQANINSQNTSNEGFKIPLISLNRLSSPGTVPAQVRETPVETQINDNPADNNDNEMKQTGPIQFGVKRREEVVDELE